MNTLDENEIIAVIHHNGRWGFYANEQETFVLDQNAWEEAYRSAGFSGSEPGADDSDRFGIPVVNESTANHFIAALLPKKLEEGWLQEKLRTHPGNIEWDEVSHLFPKVLIDFEAKQLASVNMDGIQFELYVPLDWRGEVENFYDQIPIAHRYWIDGERDYLEECIENSKNKHSSPNEK